MRKFLYFICCFLLCGTGFADAVLRDNLSRAKAGDFIVTAQIKCYTLLTVQSVDRGTLKIEEITVPDTSVNPRGFDWKGWVAKEAPGNTSWLRYGIDVKSGELTEVYSFTRRGYMEVSGGNQFLSQLLNLQMNEVPISERRRIGPKPPFGAHDNRRLWTPQMVVDGQPVQGVAFRAWRTTWPRDGSELAGRTIEIFVPEAGDRYPAYFPYWLQVSGGLAKAKIRIIDSGTGLVSPKPAVPL